MVEGWGAGRLGVVGLGGGGGEGMVVLRKAQIVAGGGSGASLKLSTNRFGLLVCLAPSPSSGRSESASAVPALPPLLELPQTGSSNSGGTKSRPDQPLMRSGNTSRRLVNVSLMARICARGC